MPKKKTDTGGLVHVKDLKEGDIVHRSLYNKDGTIRGHDEGEGLPAYVYMENSRIYVKCPIVSDHSSFNTDDDVYFKMFDIQAIGTDDLYPGAPIENSVGDSMTIDFIDKEKNVIYTTNRGKNLNDDERVVRKRMDFINNMLTYKRMPKTKGKVKLNRKLAGQLRGYTDRKVYLDTETLPNDLSDVKMGDYVYKITNGDRYYFIRWYDKNKKGVLVTQSSNLGVRKIPTGTEMYYHDTSRFSRERFIIIKMEKLREKIGHQFEIELVD